MAARNKQDFLAYAEQYRAEQRHRSFADDPRNYVGNAASIEDVRGADAGSDWSESTSDAAAEGDGSNYTRTAYASEGDDTREYGSDSGGDGFDTGAIGSDSETGVAGRNAYPAYTAVPGSSQPAATANGLYDDSVETPYSEDYAAQVNVKKTRSSWFDKQVNNLTNIARKAKPARVVKTGARKFLTIAEVQRDRQKLYTVIEWTTENMDVALKSISKGHEEVVIWSNMTSTDMYILTDFLMEQGQRIEIAATAVRQMVTYYDKARVGLIVGPRVYLTIMHLVDKGISLR